MERPAPAAGGNGSAGVATESVADLILTAEDVRARAEAEVEAAYQQRMAEVSPEQAEPDQWWDVAALGPIQLVSPGAPLLPHQIIKVGEQAFIVAVVLLNPFLPLPGGTNAGDVLSNFALPLEVQYQAGNLTTWSLGQADMQAVHTQNLVPGQYFYVDVLPITGSTPGLYEMNISSRLLGAAPPDINAPQFAAFATTVFGLDSPGLFGPAPPGPMRFQIYAA
jgi:hypothetical protein